MHGRWRPRRRLLRKSAHRPRLRPLPTMDRAADRLLQTSRLGLAVQELMVWANENLQAPNAQVWADTPRLAQGGIAMGPTLAMVGDSINPEVIAPLPRGGLNGMGGLTVYIQGDVLNGEDFYEKVNEARLEFARRGN